MLNALMGGGEGCWWLGRKARRKCCHGGKGLKGFDGGRDSSYIRCSTTAERICSMGYIGLGGRWWIGWTRWGSNGVKRMKLFGWGWERCSLWGLVGLLASLVALIGMISVAWLLVWTGRDKWSECWNCKGSCGLWRLERSGLLGPTHYDCSLVACLVEWDVWRGLMRMGELDGLIWGTNVVFWLLIVLMCHPLRNYFEKLWLWSSAVKCLLQHPLSMWFRLKEHCHCHDKLSEPKEIWLWCILIFLLFVLVDKKDHRHRVG